MPRFITNRWWTFILVLFLGVSMFVVAPSHPTYADSMGGLLGTGDNPNGGSTPPPNGDPDYPILSTKRGTSVGRVQQPGTFSMRAEGDSRMTDSAVMWRLRVAMRALKGFYLHY